MNAWKRFIGFLTGAPAVEPARRRTIIEQRLASDDEANRLALTSSPTPLFDALAFDQRGNPLIETDAPPSDPPPLALDPRDPLDGPAFRPSAPRGKALPF